jgi:hypothetical protein
MKTIAKWLMLLAVKVDANFVLTFCLEVAREFQENNWSNIPIQEEE